MLSEKKYEDNLLLIGEKIAARRHVLGEKIDTVAIATGLSKSVISKIENGRYKSLKVATIITLCRYLDIPEMDLMMTGDKT